MKPENRIIERGNSLIINELYFCIDRITAVVLKRRCWSLLRIAALLVALFDAAAGGVCLLFEWQIAADIFFLLSLPFLLYVICARRSLTLRIGTKTGFVNVLTSKDARFMERTKAQIDEIIARHRAAAQVR